MGRKPQRVIGITDRPTDRWLHLIQAQKRKQEENPVSEAIGILGFILLGCSWLALRDMSSPKSQRRPRR
jgi:hypothetical protein